jgi:hypothetical protein
MKPTPATEFFQAMTDLLTAGEPQPAPRKQFSCNACLDSGELSEGGPCNWCTAGDSATHTGPARGSMAEFDRKMAAYRAKCAAQKMEDE